MHKTEWESKKKIMIGPKTSIKEACVLSVKISLNSKKAGESLILSPLGLESPAIHKVTVHPTGKHSLQPAITFDCISLHNLETLFTQPKTIQSSGRAGSIESMSSDSFFPKALQLTCFGFLVWECYKDKCGYITWKWCLVIDPTVSVDVLEEFHKDVLYDCYMLPTSQTHEGPQGEVNDTSSIFSSPQCVDG